MKSLLWQWTFMVVLVSLLLIFMATYGAPSDGAASPAVSTGGVDRPVVTLCAPNGPSAVKSR